MKSSDAKVFVGQTARLHYLDRAGNLHMLTATVYDVGFLPHHGSCLITSEGEIKLDRIQKLETIESQKAA